MSKVIFVGNISWSMTEDSLAEAFSKFGVIASCRIITSREGRSKGYGYVEFETPESAQKALELNQTELLGREIKVDLSTPKDKKLVASSNTLLLASLSFELSREDVFNLVKEFGEVSSLIYLMNHSTGKPKGVAYVTFKTLESSQAAFEELNGKVVNDRSMKVSSHSTKIIFLGNLPFEAKEEDIKELFGDCTVRLPSYEDGRSKGFGYVEFSSDQDGVEAFERLDGQEFFGRKLRLDFSQSSSQFNSKGNRGRGGSRGRRGSRN
jgi:RNA recognition motif-containing protein